MTILLTHSRKKYEVEVITTSILYNGQIMNVIHPAHQLGLWAVKYGPTISPLFHEDYTPVLGTYKRPSGHKGVFQVMLDIATHKVVKELKDREKGVAILQKIENVHTQPCNMRFW